MADLTRIKINLESGEVELEGSREFVENQLNNLANLIHSFKAQLPGGKQSSATKPARAKKPVATKLARAKRKTPPSSRAAKSSKKLPDISEPFGNWYRRFPENLSQNDQVLLAGQYLTSASEKATFTSSQAKQVLGEQGAEISNPSSSLTQLLKSNKVLISKKEGRTTHYQVSDTGKQYLSTLSKK